MLWRYYALCLCDSHFGVVGIGAVWYKARALEAINSHVYRHIMLGAPKKEVARWGIRRSNPENRNEPRDLFSPAPYLGSKWRMLPPFANNSALQQAMQFHLRALLKIKDLSENNNFKFTYVFIYTGLPYDDLFLDILKSFCEVNNINFLNMKSIFENAQANGDELFLPRDGHFTSRGAYVTANSLAKIYLLPSVKE